MENILLSPITLKDFEALIRNCIKSEFQSFSPPQPVEDELITSKQAAKILGISLVTLHFWKTEGRLKFYRIGTRIRFKKNELLEALETTKKYGRK